MTNTITLPRSVVEQALKAWAQARGALAYVAVGNAPSNPNLARSTCSQAVWVLDNAEPALRAALEQPQVEQEPVEYWTVANGWVSEQAEVPAAAWVYPEFWDHCKNVGCGTAYRQPGSGRQPLYTCPQPKREALTAEQIADIEDMFSNEFGLEAKHSIDFARAIERAHGIVGDQE